MDELNSILEQCRDKSKQQEQDGVSYLVCMIHLLLQFKLIGLSRSLSVLLMITVNDIMLILTVIEF